MIKVLLVEDNKEISNNIVEFLNKDFDIETVYNGSDAIDYLNAFKYDVVILDLMLPEVSGISILSHIKKQNYDTGVLILTAKEDIGQKLEAFELGANDYLTKPFFMEELKARLYALLKTKGLIESSNSIVFKDLHFDLKSKKVSINDNVIELSEKLKILLEYLLLNKGVALFKEQIFERICGYDSDASIEIVEVYISHLRKKLSPFGYDKNIITLRGRGYILDEK